MKPTRVRLFEVLPSEENAHQLGVINAKHEWGMPGVICPVCGNTWTNIGLAYPLISLSSFRFEKEFRIPRAVPLTEFNSLKTRLAAVIPSGTFIFPGTEFGPLIGKATGTFDDFAWLNPWTLLIKADAYKKLKAKGVQLPSKARHKLIFRRKDQSDLFELQIEPFAETHSSTVEAAPCPGCGYAAVSFPDPVVVNQSSLPKHVDLFRAKDFTTLLLASANFKHACDELRLIGIEFREVSVLP